MTPPYIRPILTIFFEIQAHNIGLCLVYALVGFVPSFLSTPLAVYLVRSLNAHPVIQNQVMVCTSLPWAFKFFLGFTSDAMPLCGERRRPYILFGVLLWGSSLVCLGLLDTPSAPTLGIGLCISTMGMVMCDTISDAMIVERSTKEDEDDHGHLQSLVYTVRFGFAVLGSVLGSVVYNETWTYSLSFEKIMCLTGLAPLLVLLPSISFLKDMHRSLTGMAAGGVGIDDRPSVSHQLQQIWETVTLRVVFQPMTFIFIYNLFQGKRNWWQ